MNHFPDLSNIVTEKRLIRGLWLRLKQHEEKVEINRLANLLHKHFREFRIEKFKNHLQQQVRREVQDFRNI